MADGQRADPAVRAQAYRSFCNGIIDVVAPWVPAVKPQAAFFEALGPLGMAAMADVVRYARSKDLLVIIDGKRNDIGSTALAYAAERSPSEPAVLPWWVRRGRCGRILTRCRQVRRHRARRVGRRQLHRRSS